MRLTQKGVPNKFIITLLIGIIFLLVITILSLSSAKSENTLNTTNTTSSTSNTNRDALEELSANYKSCVQEGDKSYQDALNKVPEGTDSTTRWSYIQSVQQIVDSHKANCDRIYESEKDKLSLEEQQ